MKETLRGQLLYASTLGLSCVVNVVVGGVIGYCIDRYFATSLWVFVFLFFGFIAAFRTVYTEAKRLLRDIHAKD